MKMKTAELFLEHPIIKSRRNSFAFGTFIRIFEIENLPELLRPQKYPGLDWWK